MPHGKPTQTKKPPLNQGGSPTQTGRPPLTTRIRSVNGHTATPLRRTQTGSPPLPPGIPGINVKRRRLKPSETRAVKLKPPAEQITVQVKQPEIKKTPGTTGGLPKGPESPPLNPKKEPSVKVTWEMLKPDLYKLFDVWRTVIEKNDFGNTPGSKNNVMNLMSQEQELNNNRIFNWLKSIKLTSKLEYTYDNYITNYQYYNASDLLNCIPCIARECGALDFIYVDKYKNEYGKEKKFERHHSLPSELCAEGMDALKEQIKKLFYEKFYLDNEISQEIQKEIKKSEESLDKIHTVRFNEFLHGPKYRTTDKIKELRKTNLMNGFNNYTDALEKEIVKTKPTESEKGSDEKDETSLKPINLLDTFCESLKNARVAVNGITPKRCSKLQSGSKIILSDLKNVNKANKDAFVNEAGSKYRDQLIRITRSETSKHLYYLAKILHYIDENINKNSESKNIYDILDKYSKQISKLKPSFFSNATISNNQVKGVIQNAINTTRKYIKNTMSISSDSK